MTKPGAGRETSEIAPRKRFGTFTNFLGSRKEKVRFVSKLEPPVA